MEVTWICVRETNTVRALPGAAKRSAAFGAAPPPGSCRRGQAQAPSWGGGGYCCWCVVGLGCWLVPVWWGDVDGEGDGGGWVGVGVAVRLHFASAWEAVSDVCPEAEAVVQGERRLSYGEFDEAAARFAAALTAAGLGPGAKVALYLFNSVEYLVAQYRGVQGADGGGERELPVPGRRVGLSAGG